MRPGMVCTLSLLFALPLLAYALDQGEPPFGCGHAKQGMSLAAHGLSPDGRGGPPRAGTADTDLLHYQLDIELDPLTAWLGGSSTMTIKSLVDGLVTFEFQLYSGLPITDVQLNGSAANWVRLDPVNVQVALDRPYSSSETFTVYVAYSGYPIEGPITFRFRNGAPDVYTFAEPWFSSYWRPCKNDLADKATAELWFTVPDTMVVGSNGLLQGIDDIAPGKLRYRWMTNYLTAEYLLSLGASNYHQFGGTWQYQGHTMPLAFFIYPEDDSPAHREIWLGIGQALTTYSDLFGIYPFVDEKYGMLEWGWGGAMEHQTLTSIIGDFSLDWIMVHELAHQWWGDNVTCGTWHDIWLNEGFATYCEALWYEFRPGGSEQALHAWMAVRRPTDASGTVYCDDVTDPYRILDNNLSYRKGAWVLHMLRHVLGDTNFFHTLAAYRAAYQGGTATTDDFRQVAESVAGRDLAWFFDEWVYGGGAPQYYYGWNQYVVDGVGYVELYLEQVSSPNPAFAMPIDVVTHDATGPHTHVIWNDGSFENLLFQVESTSVTSVDFDPERWILWTHRSPMQFVEGPPKIVTMIPAPNQAVIQDQQPAVLEIVFHKDVVAQASDFTLSGERTGTVSFTFSYDDVRHAAHLAPAAPLGTDTYTLVAQDSIVEATYGLSLDGELIRPDSPNPLPSGDGVPSGSAFATFYIAAPADLNCDGVIDFNDVNPFVQALSDPADYAAEYPGCPIANADCNGDGGVDFGDINPFVELLSGP